MVILKCLQVTLAFEINWNCGEPWIIADKKLTEIVVATYWRRRIILDGTESVALGVRRGVDITGHRTWLRSLCVSDRQCEADTKCVNKCIRKHVWWATTAATAIKITGTINTTSTDCMLSYWVLHHEHKKKEKSIAFYLVVNDCGPNTLIFAGAPPEMTEEQLCHLLLSWVMVRAQSCSLSSLHQVSSWEHRFESQPH